MSEAQGPPAGNGSVVVCVLGLEGVTLAAVVGRVGGQCRLKSTRPVFVTDGLHLMPFADGRHAVEHVIDAELLATIDGSLAWHHYRLRQFERIGRRWRPRAVINYGRRPPEECLRALGRCD
jgi:hypothetical protein